MERNQASHRADPIRLTVPSLDKDDLAEIGAVLATRQLVQGPKVLEFERAVAGLVGTAHAVAVSNCTAALHLSLLATAKAARGVGGEPSPPLNPRRQGR